MDDYWEELAVSAVEDVILIDIVPQEDCNLAFGEFLSHAAVEVKGNWTDARV